MFDRRKKVSTVKPFCVVNPSTCSNFNAIDEDFDLFLFSCNFVRVKSFNPRFIKHDNDIQYIYYN